MFSETVTLMNYHAATDKWYPTEIAGADVGASVSSSHSAAGEVNTSNIALIVNCQNDKSIGNKAYLTPKEYAKCSNPFAHFTFRPECDFFICGVWNGGETSDSLYESGLYHYLNEERDRVYMITSVEFYQLLPHFEIGGK